MIERSIAQKNIFKDDVSLWASFLAASGVLTMCGYLFTGAAFTEWHLEIDLIIAWGLSLSLFFFWMVSSYKLIIDRIVSYLFLNFHRNLYHIVVRLVKHSISILFFFVSALFFYNYSVMVLGIGKLGEMTHSGQLITKFYYSTIKGILLLLLIQLFVTFIVLIRIAMKRKSALSYWRIALCSLIPILFTIIQVISSPMIWIISGIMYLMIGIIFWVLRGGSDL